MEEHDVECPECDAQYTIIVHDTEGVPTYCAFCGSQLLVAEDDE